MGRTIAAGAVVGTVLGRVACGAGTILGRAVGRGHVAGAGVTRERAARS